MTTKMCSLILIAFAIDLSSVGAQDDYYPMAVGNLWHYEVTTYDWMGNPLSSHFETVEIIGDSLLPNGETYFVLSQPTAIPDVFVRRDSQFVYHYPQFGSSEAMVFDLFAPIDSSYSTNHPFFASGVVFLIDTVTIFGTTSWTRLYYFYNVLNYGYRLSRDFGPIIANDFNTADEYDSWRLVGCVIGGTQYGVLTDINSGRIPIQFELFQNYPNPFNPTTTIVFYLPRPDQAKLTVFNVLGQEVMVLIDQFLSSGEHSYSFSLEGYSSGLYLYRLVTTQGTSSRKMLMTK